MWPGGSAKPPLSGWPGGSAKPPLSGSPGHPAALWQHAIDLGVQGSYARACAAADQLGEFGGRWASVALSTRASHLRQVGVPSPDLDQRALALADDEESEADALIGLAADAIAVGDATLGAELHARGESVALQWRPRTRWHWVGAELGLLTGDRERASDHALLAVASAQGRSDRHLAKSRIVAAAATGDTAELEDVLGLVLERGWHTLTWPLALVAADHPPGDPMSTRAAWTRAAWTRGTHATHVIERGLSPNLRQAWLAHPGVRRLRGDGPDQASE